MFGAHTIDGTRLGITVTAGDTAPRQPVDWRAKAEKWESEAEKWRGQAGDLRRDLRTLQARHNRALHRRARRRLRRMLGRGKG
jgi:hypothetical protein